MSIIYRKSNNIIDFMNCSKSQLNASYKYWFIKLSIFMWVYGWKVSVCIGWQCMQNHAKSRDTTWKYTIIAKVTPKSLLTQICIENIHLWENVWLSNILKKKMKVVSRVASISNKRLRWVPRKVCTRAAN